MNKFISTLSILFIFILTLAITEARADVIDTGDEKYHVVIKGDTLWDISEAYFDDPFTWPSLWKKNPEIRNPHLIYPGDTLRLTATSIEVVKRGPIAPPPIVEEEELPELPPIIEEEEEEYEPYDPGSIEEADEDEYVPEDDFDTGGYDPIFDKAPEDISKRRKIKEKEPKKTGRGTYVPPILTGGEEDNFMLQPIPPPRAPLKKIVSSRISKAGFVSKNSLDISGYVISGHDEQKLMFHRGDKIFINVTHSKEQGLVGDRYIVYREGKKIYHPKTDRYMGKEIQSIGELEIIKSGRPPVAKIMKASLEIKAGMKIRPYKEPVNEIEIIEPASTIKAVIIESMGNPEFISTHDIVYLDKGEEKGLIKGNIMEVYRSRKPVKDPNSFFGRIKLPPKVLGSLVVLESSKEHSTALILSGSESILIGDHVRTVPAMVMPY